MQNTLSGVGMALRPMATPTPQVLVEVAKAGSAPVAEVRKTIIKLAQKLGQLQPFVPVFPQGCTGQLVYLGQPNTFLARGAAGRRRRRGPRGRAVRRQD
jgi:hypothetical protein